MRVEGRDELSTTLKRLRTDAGLTQEELAERAGISARTVSDIERGLRASVYPDTARRLVTALGVAAERKTTVESILRGRGSEDERGLAGLPDIATSLLGRTSELAAITHALAMSGARVVTLTGTGGIGKTRLALEAARRLSPAFADGVVFVRLDAVRDPGLVAPTMAHALGIVETGGRVAALLERELVRRHSLVVLDTFEHLSGANEFMGALAQLPLRTRLLVTSRRPLHIRGELEFAVPPLEVPGALAADAVADLERWPSTALFIERLAAADPFVRIDDATARTILDICRRVNGVPLAIELAAARGKHMPLEVLASQLDERLDVLARGPIDLPERQRTMRETVGWSYDLLPESARSLFRRLSVLSGWDIEAARAVCGDATDDDALLDALSTLVDDSLVVYGGDSGSRRYRMLDVIREYAAERLARSPEDAAAIGRLHALHYLALAEEAEPHLVRSGQEVWVRRLDLERANLRSAIAWTIQQGEAAFANRFTIALWRYWRHTGELAEGRRWSEAALATKGDVDDVIRARALWATAFIAFPQGDYARMAELAREDLQVARRSRDPLDLRNALTIAGQVALCEGRYSDALAPLRESLAICRRLGVSWHLGVSHLNYGNALLHAGDREGAERVYAAGLEVFAELGDETFSARMRVALSQTALLRDDMQRAEDLARDALRGFVSNGERLGIAEALDALAGVAAANGNIRRSAVLDGAAHRVQTTIASCPAPFERAITRSFIARAREGTDPDAWRSAWDEGNALEIEEAVRRAGAESAA